LQLRKTLRVEKWKQKQSAYGGGLERKRNQGCPAAARTISPRVIEQGISKHGVLLNWRASAKDTGIEILGREAIVILQK
jgi:hypothetical protein